MFKLLTLLPTAILRLIVKNLAITLILSLFLIGIYSYSQFHSNNQLKAQLLTTRSQQQSVEEQLASVSAQYQDLKNQDQIKRNNDLQDQINHIHDNYQQAISTYQSLQDLKAQSGKSYSNLDTNFANILKQLSNQDYAGASKSIVDLNTSIQSEQSKLTPSTPPQSPAGAPTATTNTPPGSGYARIAVTASTGTFTVDIVSADLNSTKVIVDTASEADCANNCLVMPLASYAARSGAYAAIAGPFFCPAAYPSCAGKTNSFDTLLMNKNKHYFNSNNNVYSTIPAGIFSAGSARFVSQSLEWGRDTSPDAVIANFPLLVAGNNVVYGGSGDPKLNSKGSRGFIATKGSKVFIGYVLGADTNDSAQVLKALGMDQALNLDEGGSTALWFSGKYIDGPGRDLPFGVLFVNR